MKIKQLFLQNFRCFDSLEIDFDQSLTVIVGENGAGKTAILDAIAVAFGRFLTKLPNISGISIKYSDIRLTESDKKSAFAQYWISIDDFSRQSISWAAGRRRDTSDKTAKEIRTSLIGLDRHKTGFKEIDRFANDLINKFNDNEGYKMPLIAYYGTNRAILEEVKRRRNFKKEFSRFESLVSALNPNARFKDAFEWFNAMEDLERREQQERRSFNYRLPELDTVRKAIEAVLPGFCRPRTEIRPLRFVIDHRADDGSICTFRVNQLSDGYRVMLGLVMDLARRMAQANPPFVYDTGDGRDITDPLKMEAIVLIDEIDLHLHPKWQQRVLIDLQRTFENCQFIVTTHSPQVLTTVPSECIRIIEDGQIHSAPPGTEGAETSRILKRVLGVDVRPPENSATKEINEYLALVDADQWNSPRALELRSILDARYQGEEPALLDADLLIENRKWELGH